MCFRCDTDCQMLKLEIANNSGIERISNLFPREISQKPLTFKICKIWRCYIIACEATINQRQTD